MKIGTRLTPILTGKLTSTIKNKAVDFPPLFFFGKVSVLDKYWYA